jgi:hypothetical protein
MKTNIRRMTACAPTGSLMFAGCGSGLSGEYGGEQCLYDKLVFEGDDTVYVTFFGVEQPGTYRVDDERVIITAASGDALVFKRNGRSLEAGALGETMVCSPQ